MSDSSKIATTTIRIDKPMHTEMKVEAAMNQITLQDLIRKLFNDYKNNSK